MLHRCRHGTKQKLNLLEKCDKALKILIAYLIELCQEFVWVCTFEKVNHISPIKECVFVKIFVCITRSLFLFGVNKFFERANLLGCISVFSISMHTFNILKSILRVQKTLIDSLSFIAETDHENFS